MKSDFVRKVASYMEANNMLTAGDTVVAGVSGGADSVCLLFLLCKIREELGININVIHVNHGIRKEAGSDELFVKELCKKWNITCKVVFFDIPVIARECGLSEEEAGRIKRYEAFEDEARRLISEGASSVKIAVAHNMNDSAETILFNLFRGSGIHGLTGITPTRDTKVEGVKIIRPLLCAQRAEIEAELLENGIEYVTDSTNLCDEYSRNKIRLNILPEAEKVTLGATKHIVKSAQKLADIDLLIDKLAEECFSKAVTEQTDEYIKLTVSILNANPDAIVSRVLHYCLSMVAGGSKDIGEVQINMLSTLISSEGNHGIDLIHGVSAAKSYDELIICKNKHNLDTVIVDTDFEKEFINREIKTELLDVSELPEGLDKLRNFVTSDEPLNKYTKWLDYDKIDEQIEVRNRRPGDYFFIVKKDGSLGKKALKDYLIDEKIPSAMRDKIKVVAAGNKCMWVVGLRVSEDLLLSEDTKKVIKISLN